MPKFVILIVSNENDQSTVDVIEWLLHYGVVFHRINFSTRVRIVELSLGNEKFVFEYLGLDNNWIRVDCDDLKSYWYRRGNFSLIPTLDFNASPLKNYLSKERESLVEFIHHFLRSYKFSINSFLDNKINKLIALDVAKKMGLDIPETCIVSSLKLLHEKLQTGEWIVKSIFRSSFQSEDNVEFHGGTFLVEQAMPSEKHFFPSLIQRKIEKLYELRIFYLLGEFYSSAIFSQQDPKTKIDFRNYNYGKPNRVIPYKLPVDIERKLHSLMTELRMNSGSIDVVVDSDYKYVFLEVNPVGQFQQVSIPCSYYIENIIAEKLIVA